jgi:hypothetical protein
VLSAERISLRSLFRPVPLWTSDTQDARGTERFLGIQSPSGIMLIVGEGKAADGATRACEFLDLRVLRLEEGPVDHPAGQPEVGQAEGQAFLIDVRTPPPGSSISWRFDYRFETLFRCR